MESSLPVMTVNSQEIVAEGDSTTGSDCRKLHHVSE